MVHRKLNNKLTRVMSKLSLSWLKYSSIAKIVDNMPNGITTACWVYNKETKKEEVLFSAKIVKELPVSLLTLVWQHEFLHKAMYRGIANASNLYLLNLALDATINKILANSHRKDMIKLCQYLFTEDREGVTCIANPSLTIEERNKISSTGLKSIFDELYYDKHNQVLFNDRDCYRFGNFTIPDPLKIYHKLLILATNKEKEKIKKLYDFVSKSNSNNNSGIDQKDTESNKENKQDTSKTGDDKEQIDVDTSKYSFRGGEQKERAHDEQTISQERENIKITGIQNCGSIKETLEPIYGNKHVDDQRAIETFLNKVDTKKQIENCMLSIYGDVKNMPSIDPYPMNLNRTGVELITLDVCGPDDVPLYFNDNNPSSKKKICCYFDVSGSMSTYIPYMTEVAGFLNNCEECELGGGEYNGKYCFTVDVDGIHESQWQKFKEGEGFCGGGTSFESVFAHLFNDIEDIDCIVVFTDGESTISQETADKFNQSDMKCYRVYFSNTKRGIVNSPLDQLNGSSYTINCVG